MDSTPFLTDFGIYAGAMIYCFLGAIIPLFNIEALLVVLASTTAAGREWPTMALAASISHMGGKLLLYAAGGGIGLRLPEKHRATVERTRQRFESWRHGRLWLIFLSALAGFPPFYAVSVLAGMIRVGWVRFALVGLAGRLIRFSAFLLFPKACMRIVGAL